MTMQAPSSWPPGAPGKWVGVGLIGLATLGGAGGGLASLVGALRGDDRAQVAARLEGLSGRLARVEDGQRAAAEKLVELRAIVEAREQARREQRDLARSYLRQQEPDHRSALEALEE